MEPLMDFVWGCRPLLFDWVDFDGLCEDFRAELVLVVGVFNMDWDPWPVCWSRCRTVLRVDVELRFIPVNIGLFGVRWYYHSGLEVPYLTEGWQDRIIVEILIHCI